VSDGPRIIINVPLRTPLIEIETEVMRQAVALCEGNVARAARSLDVAHPTVAHRMKKLARSEEHNPTGAAHGASPPVIPGGQGLKLPIDDC
jgi:DNA-binding NtrC family response regulator